MLFPPLDESVQKNEDESVAKHKDVKILNALEIMIVDDEPMLGEFLSELLEEHGYMTTYVDNALDALESFQTQPDKYNLLMTDQTMPKMTGTDLILELKLFRPNLPMILCTGHSDTVSYPQRTNNRKGHKDVIIENKPD